MSDYNKEKIKSAISKLSLDVDTMNKWAGIAKSGASMGWDGCKLNDSDVVTVITVNIIGISIKFTGLFVYNVNACGFHCLPELAIVEALEDKS